MKSLHPGATATPPSCLEVRALRSAARKQGKPLSEVAEERLVVT